MGERAPIENHTSRKQEHKALNIESQRGLKKGQYSSPSPVRVFHFPVYHLQNILDLSRNNKERVIFFIKKSAMPLHSFWLYNSSTWPVDGTLTGTTTPG